MLYQPDPGPLNVDPTLGNYVQRELQKLAGMLKADPNQGMVVSDFWKTVLDDPTAAASLTTLGFSTFIQTLLNDVDSVTARATLEVTQTNLGISAYIQTLMDDADAAAARVTLGITGRDSYRNRCWNPNVLIAQENGDTNSNIAVGANWVPADGWKVYNNTSAGVFSVSGDSALQALSGAGRRLKTAVVTADTSVLTTEYWFTSFAIEGYDIADFFWGTAIAKRMLVRFMFKGPAGSYSMSVRNVGATRSYTKLFTISAGQANTDLILEFIVPGDTGGTWPITSAASVSITITFAAGASFVAASDGIWSASNLLASPGQSNGAATVANQFQWSDLGVYLDVDGSGQFPKFEIEDVVTTLAKCYRYYEIVALTHDNSATYIPAYFKTFKRTTPTLTLFSGGTNGATVGALVFGASYGFRQLTSPSTPIDAAYSASAVML